MNTSLQRASYLQDWACAHPLDSLIGQCAKAQRGTALRVTQSLSKAANGHAVWYSRTELLNNNSYCWVDRIMLRCEQMWMGPAHR